MTAAAFADLVHAQPTGAGCWKARCPAHDDRCPSLSVREGSNGRVLVLCRAGCSLDAILAALKLSIRSLFVGPPPTPEQQAVLKANQEARLSATRAERQARLAALNRAEKMQAVVNALGARLAREPGDESLARLFDVACDRLHGAEKEVDRFYFKRSVDAGGEFADE